MDFLKESYKVKGATIIKNLKKRNMEGYYCETIEEAKDKVLSLINETDVVAWGGSLSVDEVGLKNALRDNNIKVIDRDTAKTKEERKELMKQALTCDVFLGSTNSITLDGELLNVDGNGNRLAAYCFGPDSVILVVGMNKVVKDLDSAFKRVRTDACVPNCIRLNAKTPCSVTGVCSECLTGDTLCGQILVTRFAKPQNRIKVILVGESLGL